MERLKAVNPKEAPQDILVKAVFLSDSLAGSQNISSFQLSRGYSPAIVVNQSNMVSQELIEAHKNDMANQALNSLLCSRNQHSLEPSAIKEGTTYFFHSDKPTSQTSRVAKRNRTQDTTKLRRVIGTP